MKDETKEERLSRYLEGGMEEEEKHALETELKQDAPLAEELELMRTTHQIVKDAGRKEVFGQLDECEKEWETNNAKKAVTKAPKNHFRWYAAAAAVLLLLGAGWWLMQPQSQSSQDLFAENFSTFRTPPVLRGAPETSTFAEAIVAYSKGDFNQSAQLLEQWKADSTLGYLANFYQGVSYLASDPPNADAALLAFNEALQSDTDYAEAARWYKALALLKLNRETEARQILERIAEQKEYQHKAAANLLKQLEQQ